MNIRFKNPIFTLFAVLLSNTALHAQSSLNIVPTMYPQGGSFDNQVKVGCTFPEGSTGVYFFNGGEIVAKPYTDSILVDRTSTLSVAGVNKEGRIITDVLTYSFTVNKTGAAWVETDPAEGERETSFYVTKLQWNNALRVNLDVSDYKSGGSKYGDPVVWLTDAQNNVLSTGTYSNVWEAGLNAFKVYLYKNYKQPAGEYDLHVAGDIFVVDDVRYEEELSFHYTVTDASAVPVFSPASGTYEAPLLVTIDYPTDGSAFYTLYKLNGGSAQSYTGPIELQESATIEAYGMNEDFDKETRHATATYVLNHTEAVVPLQAPTVTREGNTLLLQAEQGATIKFWTDDHMQNAALYEAPIPFTSNIKLSCVAYDANRVSEVTDFFVTDIPSGNGERDNVVFKTPANIEELHLEAISANGRFAVGYAGQADGVRGFIWDLSSDIITYPTQSYANQLLAVSNDGTAYGWRMSTTDVTEQVKDEDLFWGTCRNGVWTPQPSEMHVEGISAEGWLLGDVNNTPAIYDPVAGDYTYYEGNGSIVSVCGNIAAGYSLSGSVKHPAIWTDGVAVVYNTIEGSAKLSDNGEWALLGNTHRMHLTEGGEPVLMVSTAYLYPNSPRPETLRGILNDGTCFGTYDETRLSPDKGVAVVYTIDGRWRALSEWMHDEKYFDLTGYDLTSARDFVGDKSQLLLHVFANDNSGEEPFTRGVSIRFDASVRHMSPIGVNAEQLYGQLGVKVNWRAPLRDADQVVGYKVLRDGIQLASVASQCFEYLDTEVEDGKEYRYAVKALYEDGEESEPSYESTVKVVMFYHKPVRNLKNRFVGLNGLKLSWQKPLSTLPRVQYFSDENESFAFGVGAYNSEWAIRIPAAELSIYSGQQIRAFNFLPTGRQLGYELRLYAGNTQNRQYDAEPFYTQVINPEDLQYGVVNTVMLNSAQSIPAESDLYVALYVVSAGNGDILGVQYDGFRAGYTDLCRVESVHSTFVSIAEESSVTTEIVLPLGVVICDDIAMAGSLVDHYLVSNGEEDFQTQQLSMLFEGVSDGEYDYSVCAVYQDGVASEAETLHVSMKANEAVLVPVDSIRVSLLDNCSVHLEWEAPLDNDPTLIHYGDLTPSDGLLVEDLESFTAAAIYPNTMFADFGSDYEISAMYFYPTVQADFSLALHTSNAMPEELAFCVPDEIELNTVNYVKLDTPVQIDPSMNYMLSVGMFNLPGNEAPLAYDSSNHWEDGFSNLFRCDGIDEITLSEIVPVSQHPNWFIGLVIRRRNSLQLPLMGYNVIVDGEQQNETLLQTTEWNTGVLTDDWYEARIDVVYNDTLVVEGSTVAIDMAALAIEELHSAGVAKDGKRICNGQVFIRKSGQLYNLFGIRF